MSDAHDVEEERAQRAREEEMTAQLLRLAGARPDAPVERAARVRGAVHREWQTSRRRRAIRRGMGMTAAVLGAAAVLVLIVRLNAPREAVQPLIAETVATSDRIEGTPVLRRQADGSSQIVPLSPGTALLTDDVIQTDGVSRAAWLALDGSSVRLDRGSRARLVSPTVIELVEGAVYLATAEGSKRFEVRTRLGALFDVGTLFEVRLVEKSLRLRVRAGLVEIRRGGDAFPTRAGTEATVTLSGINMRQVSIYGTEWDWTASLAPTFEIEGRPLATFLEEMTRERGWALRYADAALANAAATIIMHGSVSGLSAEDALGVALATSGLQYRLRDGELLVSRPTDAQ